VELDIPNACQTHTLGVLKGLGDNECEVHAVVPRSINIRPKMPNVKFYYLWPWQFSPIGRFCFKLLSTIVMVLLCLRIKFDAIYVREMERRSGPRFCSKLFKIPLYVEINDLIVPVSSENGVPASVLRKIKYHEKSDFKQSRGLIIPSVPMRDWIINQYGLPKNKVHLVINGASVANSERLDPLSAKSKIGIPENCFCLGFLGLLYDRYDFNTILQAIFDCRIQTPNLYLVIVGEGPLTPKIKAKALELGLEKQVIFTGFIQPDVLGEIIPAFDVGLLCLTKKDALRYGPITTKFGTYALYQLPVISCGITLNGYPGALNRWVDLVDPENSQELAEKIRELYYNPELRVKKAKMLHKFAIEKLTWNAVTKDILNIIRNDITLQ
jgi:glycosyltransferase involved in cell wall biosynthesis